MKIFASSVPRVFALSALVLAACSKSNPDSPKRAPSGVIPVTLAKVETVSVDRTIPVIGTLFPKDEATLSAEVEGQVEQTLVDMGDRIQAGQVLAQIDTTAYDAQAKRSEANLAKAQASALNAQQNLKRIQELKKTGIESQSQLDDAIAAAEQARAEVKAAEASHAIARLNLERSHVKAPFAAAVADRLASPGDFMKVGSPLFRIVDDGVLKYIVQAAERFAGEVKREQIVVFTVDAFPGEKFEGRVYLISPAVNTTTRNFSFGALVHNPARKLKASTFARGELILERGVQTPVVPLEAVITFAGVTKVFVVEKEVARSREVQVGRVIAERQEILQGLTVGEAVAVSGVTKLHEGAKVRLQEPIPKAK